MTTSLSSVSGTLSSAGVGSGLDVTSIVSALMSIDQQPMTALQNKATQMQTEVSALGQLKSQLSNLGDVATNLATASTWNPVSASSSDSSSVDVSTDNTASSGQHTVQVQQLASAQVLASGVYSGQYAAVGTGTLQIQLGTTASNGAFTAGSAAAVSINITTANNSLSGVCTAINAANAGVTASIVNDSSGARLVLRANQGAANSVKITATDDDGNNTDSSGLSAIAFDPAAASGSGQNLQQTQAGQDAKYTLDGVQLTSASNTVTGALQGVTFTLKQVTTQPVTTTMSVQTTALQNNVNTFITAYNALNTLLRQQTQSDPTGQNNGPLQNDSGAIGVLNQMSQLVFGSVNGLPTTMNTLNAAGITLQQDGSLAINQTQLTAALANPQQLQQLFAQAQSGTDTTTAGIAVRFQTWAQALSDTGGMVQNELDSLSQEEKDNQSQQADMQTRLDATQARLMTQYQDLDTQMSTLNQQMAQMKSALGLT